MLFRSPSYPGVYRAELRGDHRAPAGPGTWGVAVDVGNGVAIGKLLKRLRKTMRETSFMGMPIMAGPDLAAFLNLTRSLPAAWHVTKRFGRHLIDLALHGRAF